MSESEVNPGLISANRDQNAVTNPIFIRPGDGTVNQGFTGGSADVNVTNTVTVTATDLDIRDLSHLAAKDTVQIGDGVNLADFVVINSPYGATPTAFPIAGKFESTPTVYADGDAVPFLTDENGRLEVIATITNPSVQVDDAAFTPAISSVTMVGFFVDEVATDLLDEGDGGAPRITASRLQLNRLVGSVDANRLEINANGEAEVNLQDHNIGNTNPIPISRTVDPNAEDNPLFVQITEGIASGNEQHDNQTETDLAADTTANHDIVAVGLLKTTMVTLAATGAARIEVINDALGTPVTVRFAHTNGRQGDYKEIRFIPPLETPSGQTLRLQVKNRQGASNDIHSSHSGFDV